MSVQHVLKWSRVFENGRMDIHVQIKNKCDRSTIVKTDFGKPKGHMGVCRFHSNWEGEVEKAIREWLQMEEPNFYRHGILLLVAR